jgi:hypothetical protein
MRIANLYPARRRIADPPLSAQHGGGQWMHQKLARRCALAYSIRMGRMMRLSVLVLLIAAFSGSSSAQRKDPQTARPASTTVHTSASAQQATAPQPEPAAGANPDTSASTGESTPSADNAGGGGDAADATAAATAAAKTAKPLPDGWAEGSLPDGQVFYYHIEAPEDIQWEHPGSKGEISAAAEAAAKAAAEAAAIELVTNEEKETLLAFRAAITDPDQVLRNWKRNSQP